MDIAITYCTEYWRSLTAIASVRESVKLPYSELSRVHHRIERKADRLNAVRTSLRAIGFAQVSMLFRKRRFLNRAGAIV